MNAREVRLPAGSGELLLEVSSVSHVGHVRSVNEDAVLVQPPLFAVADGMGGHAFGDRASAIAVGSLHEQFQEALPTEPGQVLAAIQLANAAVRELTASAGDDRVIAGTTLAGVALVGERADSTPRWMVFNVGDSRVYRWSGGEVAGDVSGAAAGAGVSQTPHLERVSVDHSLVQELLDAGLIDEHQARVHPDRNVITRALGASELVAAEAWLLPAVSPQTFLICSDGLTKHVDDTTIARILAESSASGGPSVAVELLLDAALAAGGSDNVTIVVVASRYRSSRDEPGDRTASSDDEVTHDRMLAPELVNTRPRA